MYLQSCQTYWSDPEPKPKSRGWLDCVFMTWQVWLVKRCINMLACSFNKWEKKIAASVLGQPYHTSCACQGLKRPNVRKTVDKGCKLSDSSWKKRQWVSEEKRKTRLGQFTYWRNAKHTGDRFRFRQSFPRSTQIPPDHVFTLSTSCYFLSAVKSTFALLGEAPCISTAKGLQTSSHRPIAQPLL